MLWSAFAVTVVSVRVRMLCGFRARFPGRQASVSCRRDNGEHGDKIRDNVRRDRLCSRLWGRYVRRRYAPKNFCDMTCDITAIKKKNNFGAFKMYVLHSNQKS